MAKSKITHGSLFSGIGGFDLAAEWAGWQNAFHCEWNEFGQKILKHYWPNAISYGDITKTDFTIHRGTIDVLTGGFPCQPYSVAGKRKGKEDDRHLWPEMLRAIREISPRYIVGENVAGLLNWKNGLVFNEVQTDMENEGYEVQPVILPACAVNAPHRRDRIWFIAYSVGNKHDRNERTDGNNLAGNEWESETSGQSITNSHDNGQYGSENGQGDNKGNDNYKTRANSIEQFKRCCSTANDAYTIYPGLQGSQRRETHGERSGEKTFRSVTESIKILSWDRWPTQSPVCGRNDGISSELDGITFFKWRNESIKAYGNAIVPQIAYQIFKAINLHMQHEK